MPDAKAAAKAAAKARAEAKAAAAAARASSTFWTPSTTSNTRGGKGTVVVREPDPPPPPPPPQEEAVSWIDDLFGGAQQVQQAASTVGTFAGAAADIFEPSSSSSGVDAKEAARRTAQLKAAIKAEMASLRIASNNPAIERATYVAKVSTYEALRQQLVAEGIIGAGDPQFPSAASLVQAWDALRASPLSPSATSSWASNPLVLIGLAGLAIKVVTSVLAHRNRKKG